MGQTVVVHTAARPEDPRVVDTRAAAAATGRDIGETIGETIGSFHGHLLANVVAAGAVTRG